MKKKSKLLTKYEIVLSRIGPDTLNSLEDLAFDLNEEYSNNIKVLKRKKKLSSLYKEIIKEIKDLNNIQ